LKLFYLDEAGDLQSLPANPTSNTDQPVFVLAGIFVDYARLDSITNDFLLLKRRFFPGLNYRSAFHLDAVLPEIKGVDIRRGVLRGRNHRRHAFGFLDKILDLLQANGVSIVARIWVKPPGRILRSTSIYTASVQRLYDAYDQYLTTQEDYGVCLLDSRTKGLNVPVAHSIFTQKFKTAPKYPRIIELPTFVHSDNHVGIQIADILCSALIASIAGSTYSFPIVQNIHTEQGYALLKQRYGERLKALQYRYPDGTGRWRGGLTVSDAIAMRNSGLMFR
jgi:hypothetical protein